MAVSELRVGVYPRTNLPSSYRNYLANVQKHFPSLGITVVPFEREQDLPRTADVLWDIRAGGGNPPLEFLLGGAPVVVTVHGFAPITLPGWECFRAVKDIIKSPFRARQKVTKWRQLRDQIAGAITHSEFTKRELIALTGLGAERIAVCHHGVDSESFTPSATEGQERSYFLHISNDAPRKNIGRILRALRSLRKSVPAELWLKLPEEHAQRYRGIAGVKVIGASLSTAEVADLYRNARGLVFPSLYEGFGMPILEAMSCACPVITSNVSACPEVAGDAAMIVDPRDVSAIRDAMAALGRERESRARLIASGLQRARAFSWRESAKGHADVLRRAADGKPAICSAPAA